MNVEFEEVQEFSKDLKKLKRFRSLHDDIYRFKMSLDVQLPGELPGTERISNLGKNVELPIFKLKHFRCLDLKGKGSRSGIRIIYTFVQKKNKIVLIQIYFKGSNQDNHDKERILKYCDNRSTFYILRGNE